MKRTALTITTATLLALSTPGNASQDNNTRLVVKTYSHLCENSQFDYRGSGTLFKSRPDDPNIYVLTSEHVMLQGEKITDGVCHLVSYQVKDASGALSWVKISAQLVVSDWQAGLAILKLDPGDSKKIPNIPVYKSFISSNPTGSSFEVAGLPYGMTEELRRDGGVFSAQQSLRHLMPNGAPVFELQDVDGEFGMSGGPVFANDGSLIGLMSHQFLVQRPGRPTAVSIFGTDNQASYDNHLILIRGADLISWLDEAFKDNFSPGFTRSAQDQVIGQDAVYAGNIKFTAISQDHDCTTAAMITTDTPSAPEGGGDPVGIGGGDPVGIGGDSPGLPKSIAVAVTLERDVPELAKRSRWKIPHLDSWYKQLYEATLRGEAILLPSIVYRDPQQPEKGISRVCVRSLEEFFRKLIVAGSTAVTFRKGGATSIDPEPQVKALMAEGAKLLEASNALHQSFDAAKHMQLVQYSRMYGGLLGDANNWLLVKPSDLAPLRCISNQSCPYRRQWSTLFSGSTTYSHAQDLLDTLVKACRILGVLTADTTTACD